MESLNKVFGSNWLRGKIIVMLIALFILSCEKDELCTICQEENQSETNQPPIAVAGADQEIMLPNNSVLLNGNTSSDQYGITDFTWEKIEGPDSYLIVTPKLSRTWIEGLVEGVYQIELTVTNTLGLLAKDTLKVTVLPGLCDYSNRVEVNAHLTEIGTLPQLRDGMAVVTSGNKIFFAGGYISSRIDIYDIDSQSWTTAELSIARYDITTVANGNKVYFAGGLIYDSITEDELTVDTVDIYDIDTDTWTTTNLSTARYGMLATVVDNKVLFVGGYGSNGDRVDIFDQSSSEWTTASLSENKLDGYAAVTSGNKVYIAGGKYCTYNPDHSINCTASANIDVYDNTTNTWSIETMYEGKFSFAGIAFDDKIYFAGGSTGFYSDYNSTSNNIYYPSTLVEIRDPSTGNSTIECLFKGGNQNCQAVQQDDKIVFFSFSRWLTQQVAINFDIYDSSNNNWYYGEFPDDISFHPNKIISVNNIIYMAGGTINGIASNKLYIIEFDGL